MLLPRSGCLLLFLMIYGCLESAAAVALGMDSEGVLQQHMDMDRVHAAAA